jgi:predicted nuclease of predicted toxin-antitoxin system
VRFLIDNALPPSLADLLRAAGYDSVHVRAYGMQAAKDEEILNRALAESFVLFRDPNLLVARDYVNMLLPALPLLEPELLSGCVAVFRNSRLRVRKLPFSG